MKTNKMISRLFTALLVLVLVNTQTFAQDKKVASPEKKKECKMKMKDCKMDKKECKMDMKECGGKDKKAGCCAKKVKITTTTTKATYVCPMHAEIKSSKPGVCPKCKMDLEKK